MNENPINDTAIYDDIIDESTSDRPTYSGIDRNSYLAMMDSQKIFK